jgi:hypothetical protein
LFFRNNNLKIMLLKKYHSIMEKPEEHRNKWALGLSVTFTVLIFISFAFYKGYLTFGNGYTAPQTQTANVVSAKSVPTPIESTGETFKTAFDEIKKQYNSFTDSLSAVFVPFITGIEVYQRK